MVGQVYINDQFYSYIDILIEFLEQVHFLDLRSILSFQDLVAALNFSIQWLLHYIITRSCSYSNLISYNIIIHPCLLDVRNITCSEHWLPWTMAQGMSPVLLKGNIITINLITNNSVHSWAHTTSVLLQAFDNQQNCEPCLL